MASPPIPDNINTGQGVDGFGIGYFSRHIPLSKGGGGPANAWLRPDRTAWLRPDGSYWLKATPQ